MTSELYVHAGGGNVEEAARLVQERPAAVNDVDDDSGEVPLHMVRLNCGPRVVLDVRTAASPAPLTSTVHPARTGAASAVGRVRGTQRGRAAAAVCGLVTQHQAARRCGTTMAWRGRGTHAPLPLTPGRTAAVAVGPAESLAGQTPLHLAASVGHEVAVRLLLNHGASVTEGERDQATPLHLACLNRHPKVGPVHVRARARARAWPERRQAHHLGRGAVPRADRLRRVQVIRLLLLAGADPLAPNLNGKTPLMLLEEGARTQGRCAGTVPHLTSWRRPRGWVLCAFAAPESASRRQESLNALEEASTLRTGAGALCARDPSARRSRVLCASVLQSQVPSSPSPVG